MSLIARLPSLSFRTRRMASRIKAMAGHLAHPDEMGPATMPVSPARRPILLLHGLGSSKRMLVPLQAHLRRTTGRSVIRVGVSSGREDLRESARRVESVLEILARSPEFEYADVIGHSMGGLVGTYLLKRIDCGRRVRHVVTLGTPHRGTPAAFVGVVFLGFFCDAVWQMLPNSSFVKDLKWTPVPEGCELVSISGASDLLVSESAAQLAPLPGHRNVRCESANHMQLLFSRPALRALRGALGASIHTEQLAFEGSA